jgi:protein-tyrosine-phosphatase
MATTESRTGFRLPWSSEERSDKAPVGRTAEATTTDEATDAVTETTAIAPAPADAGTAAGTAAPAEAPTDATTEAPTDSQLDGGASEQAENDEQAQPTASDSSPKETSVESTLTAAPAPSRMGSSAPVAKPPTKFVLDLTRAMQAAAEESRAQTLSQFQADAKTYIEEIHSRSAVEATELRKRSDDDVSGIQDWSKAEIARIREETQGKIADRKQGLERELEEHAGQIEYEIDRVQSRVAGFELEMERFFEQLVAEQDPTQIAAMAQNLPDPPSFDAAIPWQPSAAVAELIGDTPVSVSEAPAGVDTLAPADPDAEPIDSEAAMAAIEAAHQAAEAGEGEAPTTDPEGQLADANQTDPRLTALGMSSGFDAAEAEAAAEASSTDTAPAASDEEIPTIGDDALAARLAGLVPAEGEAEARPARATSEATSKVVVTGLVSVASIASFKRHLGRVAGVQSVGVSSGPDGEFVFTVSHDAGVNPSEVVPTLPGFRARVTNVTDNVISVAAHDPESGS